MIQQLLDLINQTNPEYTATFEESKMMNVVADTIQRAKPFAYIEEYRSGSYTLPKYIPRKTTKIEIYFCRFTEMHCEAIEREALRTQIEAEVVIPFMESYNSSGYFSQVNTWLFTTPIPRFDANEVSIRLSFDCIIENMC